MGNYGTNLTRKSIGFKFGRKSVLFPDGVMAKEGGFILARAQMELKALFYWTYHIDEL